MKPFWVTFYSYKGGVGRSLSLANIASLLVRKGRRVLLIDFDLEAPGLDSFDEFKAAAKSDGVVEYVSQYLRYNKAPEITKFVHKCDLGLASPRGGLWLMPAGRKDTAYNQALSRISWSDIYEKNFGSLFFSNWKAAINEEYKPDYVFVDSRTGLTEVGGVCTTQFPDLVMMLFGLNDQNIEGTLTVAQSIRDAESERSAQLHFVASPVPNLPPENRASAISRRSNETRGLLAERFALASEKLGAKSISTIRYFAPAALHEELFVLDDAMAGQPIVNDYYKLCDDIISYNRLGMDFLLNQAEESIGLVDLDRAHKIVSILEREFPERAEVLIVKARLSLLSGNSGQAIDLAEAAFGLDPIYEPASRFLQSQYVKVNNTSGLIDLYGKLIALRENLDMDRVSEIYRDYGELLMRLGNYAQARDSYARCLAILNAAEVPPALALCAKFNFAEASRRCVDQIDSAAWEDIIQIFHQAGSASDAPLNAQANQWQAMHVAFACIGDVVLAKDALKKARRAADSIGEVDEIFCVSKYTYVSAEVFLNSCDKMLDALNNGMLWDGMKLPSLKS